MSSYENHSLPVRATSSLRVVVNGIPGGVRSFIRMMPQLKIAWVCFVGFYAFIGAFMECPAGGRIAWYAIFTVLWTVVFAAFSSWIDNQD